MREQPTPGIDGALLAQLADSHLETDRCFALLRHSGGLRGEAAARTIHAWTRHPNYLVRSRAWVTLCQVIHPALITDLINDLREERDVEFRLRCLEVLRCLQDPAAVFLLAPLLHDRDPLVVRGTVLTIGAIGGEEAVRVLLTFASSPPGRLVRRELVGEALAMALSDVPGREVLLAGLAAENPQVARYLSGLPLEYEGKPRFSIYPAPDYFRLQCLARGENYQSFKLLMD